MFIAYFDVTPLMIKGEVGELIAASKAQVIKAMKHQRVLVASKNLIFLQLIFVVELTISYFVHHDHRHFVSNHLQ